MATWAQLVGYQPRSAHSVQAQTEAGPPGENDGVALERIGAVVTFLKAPAGQTFTGAGFLRAWLKDPVRGVWARAPRADEDLVDFAGLAEASLESVRVGSPRGRFAWLCDGVGLSGAGGDVELDLACTGASGESL